MIEIKTGLSRYENQTLLCLGDSITSDYSEDHSSWVQMLRDNLPVKDIQNYGIAGTMMTRTAERTDSFVERYSGMQKEADTILVYGGINDFNHSVPLGTFLSDDIDTFYGAVNHLCRELVTIYPCADLVFLTPMHAFGFKDYPHWATANAAGNRLVDYVNAIRETCEYYSIPVLDLYKNSGMTPDIEASNHTFLEDGLHPNRMGRERICRKIMNFLLYQL